LTATAAIASATGSAAVPRPTTFANVLAVTGNAVSAISSCATIAAGAAVTSCPSYSADPTFRHKNILVGIVVFNEHIDRPTIASSLALSAGAADASGLTVTTKSSTGAIDDSST
jgi:hypothetical protein